MCQAPIDWAWHFYLRALSRLYGHKGIAFDAELAGVCFATGTAECVDAGADLHIEKTAGFNKRLPTCARQASGNSGSPQIDVASGGVRYFIAVGNIGKLQGATGTHHAENFCKDAWFVGT